MSAIEQRARMLLALALRKMGQPEHAYHVGVGGDLEADDQALIQALIAALTPPEGFVLVPVEPTVAMEDAGDVASTWLTLDETKRVWAAMLAARPEVP